MDTRTNRFFAGLAAAVALSAGAAWAAGDKSADETELRGVEAAICQAFESGDAGTLRKLLDPTFTLTNSRGEITDLQANLAEVASREPRYDEFRNHDQKLRLYGDAAIITGITTVKGTAAKAPFAADFQFTDTYVRHDGKWLLAASHASKIADKAAKK